MTNERFEFNDGKLHWISDEDTLIIDSWPSFRCQYVQGTAPDPFWIPHKQFSDTLIPQSQKSLARLLYPAWVRIVLKLPAEDVAPDDPRYYSDPFFTDRQFRERNGGLIQANRDSLMQFLATIPAKYLNEILKYECENALVVHALALDERLYDLSVAFPILFILIVLYAYHQTPIFNDDLAAMHGCSFSLEFPTIVESPEIFLQDCASQDPVNILRKMGHKSPNALLRILKKYDGRDSIYRFLRSSFIAALPSDCESDWHKTLSVLNSRVMWYFPVFINITAHELIEDIVSHPFVAGYSTENCYWMYRKLWSWTRPANGGLLALQELSECRSALGLIGLYKRILAQHLESWPDLVVEGRFPINTPELRPILNTEDLKEAVLENLNPFLSCHSGPCPYSDAMHYFRLLSPVKGILECECEDDCCDVTLYLDSGVQASRVAAREFWLMACRETDWSDCPDQLHQQALR